MASNLTLPSSPSQLKSQIATLVNQLLPKLQGQAQTSCLNELQHLISNLIPSQLTPQNLYPQHLNLCIVIKLKLEYLLTNAANLANQLKGQLSPQEKQALQYHLAKLQNQIQQLQPQYLSQKNICIILKCCNLIEGQIQGLNSQIANLIGQGQPFGLESQQGNVEAGVPVSVQPQVCNLQIKLLACIKIKLQFLTQLAQALSSANNAVPSSSLIPSNLIPTSYLESAGSLPSAP